MIFKVARNPLTAPSNSGFTTGGVLTTCVMLFVLAKKFPSLTYSAVTVFDPCGNKPVAKTACALASKLTSATARYWCEIERDLLACLLPEKPL